MITGYTIQQFEEDYKKYFYMLYTSHSHSEDHHKFRVIMYGNYDKPLNDYQQRTILSHSFRNADVTTLQPNRLFYLPARRINGPYEFRVHNGIQFPLWFRDLQCYCDKLVMDENKLKKQNDDYYRFHKQAKDIDCSKCKAVQYYLNNNYPHLTGNGDSDSSLYKAMFVCLKYGDYKTLQIVKNKARNEHWSEQALYRKEESIKKAL